MTDLGQTIEGVIGANVKRLRSRHHVTQSSLARTARDYGLKWHDTRVSELERGSLPLSVEAVISLGLAMQKVTGAPITLDDLLAGSGRVSISGILQIELARVRAILSGGQFDHAGISYSVDAVADLALESQAQVDRILGNRDWKEFHRFNRAGGLSSAQNETRLLRALGLTPGELSALAYVTWNRSVSDEREARAKPGDNAQRRGRISRELLSELQQRLRELDG